MGRTAKLWLCVVSFVWGFLVQPTNVSRGEAPSTTRPVIAEIRIEGVINPIQARYVERSIERAKAEGATLLLVSIDTPGGLVTSMQQIVSALTNAGIPVVGLVEPATAQATSAGAFILLATDLAAMQPDTRVGAAHPVGAGEKLDETMSAKATNSLVSLAKSLAARRGRSESAAEAMVRDSTSYTAKEAQEKQLIEWQVSSKQELLDRLDGHKLAFADRTAELATRNGRSLPLSMSQADKLLDRLADPTLASILLSIGVLGILYELGAPGIGLGGIVGVISLLLGLSGMSVLPINLAGALLMVAGAIAIGIELHLPTHGLVGFGGVLAMMFGGLMLFDEGSYFGALPHVDWHTQVPIVLLMGALLLLLAAQAARAQEAKPMTGPLAMVGRQAEVSSAFAAEEAEFGGTVRIDGAYWQARSNVALEAGATVEVLEVSTHPLRLRVQRSRKVRS